MSKHKHTQSIQLFRIRRSVCILREVKISDIFCFIFRDPLTFSQEAIKYTKTKENLRSYCPNTYTVLYSLACRTQAHWLQGGQFREEKKTSFQLEKRNALVKMKMPALNWLPFHLLTRGVCVMPFSVTTAVASLRFDPFFPMLGASIKSNLFFIWLDS